MESYVIADTNADTVARWHTSGRGIAHWEDLEIGSMRDAFTPFLKEDCVTPMGVPHWRYKTPQKLEPEQVKVYRFDVKRTPTGRIAKKQPEPVFLYTLAEFIAKGKNDGKEG